MTTPHLGRSLVTGAAALALVMGAAAPVHARPGALEFSQDGVLWSAAPPNALFEEQIVLVPGDSASTTLHLRNIAGSTGVLRLGLDSAEVAGEDAAEAFGITVVLTSRNAETDVPERRAVGGLEPGLAPAGEARIAPREAVAITVIVDLDAAVTGQVAQSSVLHLGLTLHLAEATDAPGGEPDAAGGAPTVTVPLLPGGGEPGADGAASAPPAAPSSSTHPADHEVSGFLARTGIGRGLLLLTGTVLFLGGLLAAAGHRLRRHR